MDEDVDILYTYVNDGCLTLTTQMSVASLARHLEQREILGPLLANSNRPNCIGPHIES